MGVLFSSIIRRLTPLAILILLTACGEPPPPPPPPVVQAEEAQDISVTEVAGDQNAVEAPANAGRTASAAAPGRVSSTSPYTLGEGVVDDMETTSGWRLYKDQTTMLRVAAVPGYRGNAVRVEYDFGQGKWLGVWKYIGDASKYRGIRFTYRCEGARNTIEYKIEDMKNTCYGRALSTEVRGWTTVEIPFSLMSYWWGDESRIDMTRLKVHFAIAIRAGDEGGKGALFIDQIDFLR